MARPGVSYADVSKVCERLKAEGKSPTINGVRNILGTGSPNNISTHINVWRVATTQSENASEILLPESVVICITNEIERCVEDTREKMQSDFDLLLNEHSKVIDHCNNLDDAIQKANDEASRANDELQASIAVISEREKNINHLDDSLKESQTHLEEYRSNAEMHRVELAKAMITQNLYSDQVKSIPDLQEKCRKYERDASVSQAKEAAALEMVERFESMISTLESNLDKANTQLRDMALKLSSCEVSRSVFEERLLKENSRDKRKIIFGRK